jgi:hypothetical protein
VAGEHDFARSLWLRIETLHAVTYFSEESVAAGRSAGMSGFWMGYFGFRAAPMGPVASPVVEATFFNFAPSFVARWVPQVWQRSSPESLVERRAEAAAATLSRLSPSIAELAATVNADLRQAVERCVAAGRPLFAANRAMGLPGDPVAALWQLCTSLREHRGDGHLAALTSAGLDGIEAHVLLALEQEQPPDDLQRARGWTEDDWNGAVRRCQDRGLVDSDGRLSAAGRSLRQQVETTTNRLAFAPWSDVVDSERQHLLAKLDIAAVAISRSGLIRYPNPIGLPSLA